MHNDIYHCYFYCIHKFDLGGIKDVNTTSISKMRKSSSNHEIMRNRQEGTFFNTIVCKLFQLWPDLTMSK